MITLIQIHQGGLIIGEVDSVHGMTDMAVKSPRVIQMEQTVPGMVNIQLTVMVGDPKEMTINQDMVSLSYVPDEALANIYREAVTGLTLAKTLPAGNVKPFPSRNN